MFLSREIGESSGDVIRNIQTIRLRFSGFILYLLSFFLNSPFNKERAVNIPMNFQKLKLYYIAILEPDTVLIYMRTTALRIINLILSLLQFQYPELQKLRLISHILEFRKMSLLLLTQLPMLNVKLTKTIEIANSFASKNY